MAMAIPLMFFAGAAISAAGAIQQANAAKAAATYNANMRQQDAKVALDQAQQDAWRVNVQGRQAEGSLLAGYGAAGVATDEGSPIDVLRMSAANAKLDEETVLYKGRVRATGYYNAAALDRLQGETAERQGQINAASAILTGAGRGAAAYYAGKRPLASNDSLLTE